MLRALNATNRFRIAHRVSDSNGGTKLDLKTPIGVFPTSLELNVIQFDTPTQLKFVVLDQKTVIADKVTTRLTKKARENGGERNSHYDEHRSVPLTGSPRMHVYAGLKCESESLLTRTKLQKLDKKFFHVSKMGSRCRGPNLEVQKKTLTDFSRYMSEL